MTSTNEMRSEFYISFVMLLETHLLFYTISATQDKYNYKKNLSYNQFKAISS